MIRRPRSLASVVLLTALAAALSGCTSSRDPVEPPESRTAAAVAEPAEPVPVALAVDGVPAGLTIGIVVSLSSPRGEGADWTAAGEGATLASWRLSRGGSSVSLATVNDGGTEAGAIGAVQELTGRGVAAIVFATSGAHLEQAIAVAAQSGTPVLLPYGWRQGELPDGVWVTGPDGAAVAAATRQAIERIGSRRPLGVLVGDREATVATQAAVFVEPQATVTDLSATLAQRIADDSADAVVVTGAASDLALVIAAVQGAGADLPVVLSPDALSPAFGSELARYAASPSGSFWVAGAAAQDASALSATEGGQAVSAFLAADRQAAADRTLTNLIGDQPFAAVAAAADIASHDAVLAVVHAAASAGSGNPADVAGALRTQSPGHQQGLAGPALDFAKRPGALGADAVVVLHASTRDAGLRPPTEAPAAARLDWFVVS